MLKKLWGAFSSRPDADTDREARVDALYAEASAAWARDDLEAAGKKIEAAIEIDNNIPALTYLQGSIYLKRSQYESASAAFEQTLRLQPRFPLVLHAEVHAALARARADLERGVAPAREPSYPGPSKKISIIVCSITPAKFDRVCANYRERLIGVPHEIIGVHDARSMCEGYSRGVARSTGDILVFSHDDIAIHAPDFADRLQNRLTEHELVGVVGSTQLSGEGWLYSRWPHMHGQVGMPAASGAGKIVTAFHMRGAVTAGAQVLDGMFLACRRDIAEDIGFDAGTFDGWHFYDFDFSYRAWRAGRRTAVCHDFLVEHASQGGFNADWLRYAQRFCDKHPEAHARFGEREAVQLASIGLDSVDEWRLFTEHLSKRTASSPATHQAG